MSSPILAALIGPQFLTCTQHFPLLGYFHLFFFFFSLKVVRHYLCLTETRGNPPCPGPPGEQVVRAKAHQEPSPSAAHLNLPAFYPGLPLHLTRSTGTQSESGVERDRPSDIFTANLFPSPTPPQMESVGVYGFCGCTAKSKMKCDSRWEVTASGRK